VKTDKTDYSDQKTSRKVQ